ncbi:hypothetical protein MNBD_GAMMA01-1878, partial [hydrothermal vent metagenome]
MIKISAVVTCFNNESTIKQCITSLGFADEIIVLDSFSTDNTLQLLTQLNCTVHQQKFKGYFRQKQDVINLASNDWVILLDSDEFLTLEAQTTIQAWQQHPTSADAYELPRQEWIFWQWSHKFVHMNRFVRLFDRKKAKVTADLVHESIRSTGKTKTLHAVIRHFGETSITKK